MDSKHIKLIIIFLAQYFSVARCRISDNTLKLNCNITTFPEPSNRQILAVNKCPEDYQNVDMIRKCEKLVDSNSFITDSVNSKMYIPVINSFKNTTYWNEYCAICNNETNLEYWPEWSKLDQVDELCIEYILEVKYGSAFDKLDEVTRTRNSIRKGLKLISKPSNSTELQCSMEENWPMNLLKVTIPCLTEAFFDNQQAGLNSCQYFNKYGGICYSMQFMVEGIDYVIDGNGKIHGLEELPEYSSDITIRGYSFKRGIDNVIYLCIKIDVTYSLTNWIEILGGVVSTIGIVIYLSINFGKNYLKSFPNKILYSYSAGLLIMYVLLTLVRLLFPLSCINFDLSLFSWFFHFFWSMIISLEFFRLTYCTVKKRKVTVTAQPVKYFVYCVFGYVIPVALPAIYFLILETEENRCPSIPGHFGIPCDAAENSAAQYFFKGLMYIYFVSFSVIVSALLILQTCVFIYITKFGSTQIRSTAKRNNIIVLMKMAYLMGAHWMLLTFLLYFWVQQVPENKNAYLNAIISIQLFSDFQGVFLFFAFTFKKSMPRDILAKCRCTGRSAQQSTSGVTAMTALSESVPLRN